MMREIASEAATKAVDDAFTRLGADVNDPLELQKDLIHLRRWRLIVDKMESDGIRAAIRYLIIGTLATVAVLVGLKFNLFK